METRIYGVEAQYIADLMVGKNVYEELCKEFIEQLIAYMMKVTAFQEWENSK